MNCQQVEEQEIIERYLASRLSARESEAFEEHYFGCSRCFEEMQLRHAAAIELKAQPAISMKAAPVGWRFGWSWSLAVAAILLLGVASIFVFHRRQAQEVSQTPHVQVDNHQEVIAQLARVETAPAYVPWTIRGEKTSLALERFQRGMQRYTEHDYAAAIVLLEEAAKLDPSHEPTLFYLGISYLMTNQPDEAIAQLSKLTHVESSPYAEEGHWYLAKAFLRKGDMASAQKELEAAEALHGPHLLEARKALAQIREIASGNRKNEPKR